MGGRGVAGTLGVALIAGGCSISASSESISKSVSSPFTMASSLSRSSGSEGDEEAYRREVAEYTDAYVRSGGQYDAFQRRVGELAVRHGISDWEANRTTYVAFGEGLKRAGVKGLALDTWTENLAGGNARWIKAIQEGYRNYEPR